MIEMDTLFLPSDFSLGKITVYPPGETQHPQLLNAQGTLHVPKGAKLFLDVSQELCDDLSQIRVIPGRLFANGLSFSEKNLDKTDFGELRSIKPNSVVFTFCKGIRVIQLLQLGELKSIEHLNLSATPLDFVNFSWVRQFPNLKTLLLVGVGADDQCAVFLSDLRYLEDLHLTHAKVSNQGVQAICKMTWLKGLNLSKCPIDDTSMTALGACLSLRSLDVSDTQISNQGVEIVVAEVLRTGQQLNSLVLRSCPVGDQALVRLASLRTLTLLDVFDTGVTEQGLSFLKESLPNCRVLVEPKKGGGLRLWQATDRPEEIS